MTSASRVTNSQNTQKGQLSRYILYYNMSKLLTPMFKHTGSNAAQAFRFTFLNSSYRASTSLIVKAVSLARIYKNEERAVKQTATV
jgi:hypothetical protein